MRRLFRWLFRLLILLLVLMVAAVLLLDTVAREVLQSRLRAATGMEVKIGKVDIGLLSPIIAIEDVKLYDTPEFGGSPWLDLPELYVEYDKEALRARKVHLRMVRLSIAEMDITRDKQGRLNLQGMAEKTKTAGVEMQSRAPGFSFTGVDVLNLSFQRLRVTGVDSPTQVEAENFNLTNQIFTNVNTQADLTGVLVVLAGRGGNASPPGRPPLDLQGLFRQIMR